MSIGLNSVGVRGFERIAPPDANRVNDAGRAGAAARPHEGAAALPGPQAARENAAPRLAARQTGLAGRIRAGLRNLRATLKAVFTRPPETYGMAETYSFSVPGHDRPVTFPRSAFIGMIRDLPKGERAAAVANLRETIQHRIFQGYEILNCVLTLPTGGLSAPRAQDVADLTLFLQMKAFALEQGFESGAFSIEDPDGKLAQYLERSPDLYLRSSTHLTRFQGETVDGHRNTQRGIDFAKGPQRALPFSRRTVVFGTIPPVVDPGTGACRAARRLYLKPETHGCRISSRSFGASLRPERYRADFGAIAHPRAWNRSDIGEAVRHLGSLISKRSEVGRRENLPREIRDGLNNLARHHPDFAARVGLVFRSFKDDPTQGAGIRSFLQGIDRLPTDVEIPDEATVLLAMIAQRWPNMEQNVARLGNEVMLNLDELSAGWGA